MMYSNKLTITLAAIFITLVVFIVLRPVLNFGFVNWDDGIGLTHNPLVRSLNPGNIAKIFSTPVNTGYSPLAVISNAVEWRFLD